MIGQPIPSATTAYNLMLDYVSEKTVSDCNNKLRSAVGGGFVHFHTLRYSQKKDKVTAKALHEGMETTVD